jgi:uncharacterized protein (TIGR03000 family)
VVIVPEQAVLTVDGNATQSTAAIRRFTTPELQPGKTYHYNLEARVTVQGKTEVLSRIIEVRAGEETRTTLTPTVALASTR